MENKQFPQRFLWGSATSAHQVEGGLHNDWTEWEEKNAERLAGEAEKKFSHLAIWPNIKAQAQDPQNYISGRACDHYNRYEEDFDIAQSLGHTAHRFSIEWSRIEPREGEFDEKEIEHYRNVVRALRARGMEPFVTLWHWTQPTWIADIGGWENKRTVEYFLRFIKKIAHEFKNEVTFFIVLNEPNIYTAFGFIKGSHPPGIKNILKAKKVYLNLCDAQKRAYKIIHSVHPRAQVGIANSFMHFEEKNRLFFNVFIKDTVEYFWNFWFLNKIKNDLDFIGCNYYSRYLVGFGNETVKTGDMSDLGWEIFPKGIYFILKRLKKYKKPMYVTENGIADAQDKQRKNFIIDHLMWMHEAIEEGVDVRGYFHWSLLDNFEFPEVRGFWPRFGLVEVDYETMERKIRPSAQVYAKICKTNSLLPDSNF
ncbi:glycoside hydrolase family 1 protein [Candidatus Azambacteria bacterium]|nr:glycoside hydrolase family 1 protein [Candidatus Azambacteria bacterium]